MEIERFFAGKGPSNRTLALADELGRQITSGALRPSTILPTETQLQQRYGVSRTMVREAIRYLVAKGLVSVGPKVGTKVRERIEWNMLDPEVMGWHLTAAIRRPFIESLYEMRLINEPYAARLAARRITGEQAAQLEEAFVGMGDNPRGSPEMIAADLAFHRTILAATGNPMLVSLGAMIERSLSIAFSLSWRQNPRTETVRQHARVKKAILSGDEEAAELFMRRLIESAFNDVVRALNADGAEAGAARVTVDAR